MSSSREIVSKTIRIKVVQHRKSDLLVAISDDLSGLMVPGRTDEELQDKIEGAIREILEAQGHTVISITTEKDFGSLAPRIPAPRVYSQR